MGENYMEKKMFYCKKCNSMKSDYENVSLKCSNCGDEMKLTNIPADEWDSKTEEQQEEIKSKLSLQNDAYCIVSDEYATLKQIAKDVHFLTGFLQVVIALVCIGLFFSLLGSCVM